MAILSIRHLTEYRYRKPVALGEHRMMFRPLESYDQRVLSSTLTISPDPSRLFFTHDVDCAMARVKRDDKGRYSTTDERGELAGLAA